MNADGATRALRLALRKQSAQVVEFSDKDTDTDIFEESVLPLEDKLPPPEMPENMQLTRNDMLRYLRINFELGKQHVASAPKEEQNMIAEASAARCAPQSSAPKKAGRRNSTAASE